MAASQPPLCLIGGTGRSGSTILRQMFSRHRRVATLPTEARFLTDPDGIVDFYDAMRSGWSPYLFDVRVKRLEALLRALVRHPLRMGPFRFSDAADTSKPHRSGSAASPAHGLRSRLRARLGESAALRLRPRYWSDDLGRSCRSYRQLVDELMDRLVDFRFEGRWTGMPLGEASSISFGSPDVGDALRWFCRSLVQCICDGQQATHFVEDTPFNLLSFDRIHALLPESRLVHIHREPRDVVASYLEKRWSPSTAPEAARYYATIMDRWESLRESLPSDSYIEISLASLVQAPAKTARRICKFWDLPWDPQVLEIDLSKSRTGRWRTDIPDQDLLAVESILRPYLERYATDAG